MSMSHLPKRAVEAACAQGWDADTTIIHLLGFIRYLDPGTGDERLSQYFERMAAEEEAEYRAYAEAQDEPHCPACGETGYESSEECAYCSHVRWSKGEED